MISSHNKATKKVFYLFLNEKPVVFSDFGCLTGTFNNISIFVKIIDQNIHKNGKRR